MKKILSVFTIAAVAAGCASNETADSSAVKQSEIHQSYSVSWDGNSQEYEANATFRFGGDMGTTLRLSSPSEVAVNGQKLNEGKMLFGGAYYKYESKTYSEKHSFEFTDTDKKKYSNSFSFPAIDFTESPAVLSTAAPVTIGVSRDITAGDELKLSVKDTSATYSADIKTTATEGAEVVYDAATKKIVIQPAFFRNMANVPLTLWLESSFIDRPLKETGAKGGSFSFSYTSHEIKARRGENVK